MGKLSDISDINLCREIKAGNKEALKELYFRYYDPLYQFIWQRLYSTEHAKDFMQEIFTRIWQNKENIDKITSIKAYLFRMANNMIIDYIRKKSVRNTYMLEQIQSINQTQDDSTSEIQEALLVAINKLPDKLQVAIKLNRYQGLTYAEIAEVCNVSIKTIEKRISKALQILRNELKKEN